MSPRLRPGEFASVPGFLDPQAPLGSLARSYLDALLDGRRHEASRLILEGVSASAPIPVKDIYIHVFQPALYEVGRLWEIHQISVAQEHYCTAATQMIMSQLYPLVFSHARVSRRLVATAVLGNLHEVGVRCVADFFEMAGWDTYYLGASVPLEDVIREVNDRRADVLAVSATLTKHLSGVRALCAAIRADARCSDVVVLVGGAPFRVAPGLWRRVGADGSADGAEEAVALAERLLAARVIPEAQSGDAG